MATKYILIQSRHEPKPLFAKLLGNWFFIFWLRPRDIGAWVHLLKGGLFFGIWPLGFAVVWNAQERIAEDGPDYIGYEVQP